MSNIKSGNLLYQVFNYLRPFLCWRNYYELASVKSGNLDFLELESCASMLKVQDNFSAV